MYLQNTYLHTLPSNMFSMAYFWLETTIIIKFPSILPHNLCLFLLFVLKLIKHYGVLLHTVGQSNQECKETSRIKFVSDEEKFELRILHNKKKNFLKFWGLLSHKISLKFKQKNKEELLKFCTL